MKNILPKYVHASRIRAVRLTPVKIASNGTAWSARNGIEVTQFTRRAARGAGGLPGSGCGASSTFVATRPLSVMMAGGSPYRLVGSLYQARPDRRSGGIGLPRQAVAAS